MSRRFFRRILPDADTITRHRWLHRLGPWFRDPRLWYVNHRTVAHGLAIGVFFGLLFPAGQMPIAGLVAILLHRNLPAALLGTFVSNPVTFVPIYVVAYRIGAALLDLPPDESWRAAFDQEADGFREHARVWWSAVWAAGRPLALGLVILATGSAVAVYYAVGLAWRTSARRRIRRRKGG